MQSHIIQCQQNKTNKSETLSVKVKVGITIIRVYFFIDFLHISLNVLTLQITDDYGLS